MTISIRLLVTALLAFASLVAQALDLKPYSADALKAAQAAGVPVALHFHADWCPVCKAQQKYLQGFGSADAAPGLVLLVADFDRETELRRQLGVRSQSTLIVWKGAKETARLVGGTAAEPLRQALLSAR